MSAEFLDEARVKDVPTPANCTRPFGPFVGITLSAISPAVRAYAAAPSACARLVRYGNSAASDNEASTSCRSMARAFSSRISEVAPIAARIQRSMTRRGTRGRSMLVAYAAH